MAALAVGDTVYRIAPRAGRTYPDVFVNKAGVGDISELTSEDDESMASNLDDMFADGMRNGLDADEMASLRTLAAIAKPHDSSWGEEFFKDPDGKVGGVSPYTMGTVTGAWDPTLGASMATSATTGPMSFFSSSSNGGGAGIIDLFALGGGGNGMAQYAGGGGGGGGASGSSNSSHTRPAVIVSSLEPTPLTAVPEPGTLSLLGVGAAGLLARRRRTR